MLIKRSRAGVSKYLVQSTPAIMKASRHRPAINVTFCCERPLRRSEAAAVTAATKYRAAAKAPGCDRSALGVVISGF